MMEYYYMFMDGAYHLKRSNFKMFVCMIISLILPIISLGLLILHLNNYFGICLFLWCTLVAFNIVTNYVFRIDWYARISSKIIKGIILLGISIIFIILIENMIIEFTKIIKF